MKRFTFEKTPLGVRQAIDAMKADPELVLRLVHVQCDEFWGDAHAHLVAHAAHAEMQLGDSVPTPGLELLPDDDWLRVLLEIASAACSRLNEARK